ncbi:MAG: hypothetical protein WAO76_05295 [Georgfuchsia sp.]
MDFNDILLNPKGSAQVEIEMARSTEEQKKSQLARLADIQKRNRSEASRWLARLRQTVIEDGNVFAVRMDAVRYCTFWPDHQYTVGSRRQVSPQ